MTVMALRRSAASLAVLGALAGCGSTVTAHPRSQAVVLAPAPTLNFGPDGSLEIPAPGPTGRAADPAAVAVIKAWSSTLRRGDVTGAARLFAVPSAFVNGGGADAVVVHIESTDQAVTALTGLPCGALFLSADQRGAYVNARFRLTRRPGPGGGACATGAGQTARTNFLIRDGRIVEWLRAPDDPGDNGAPASPAPPATGQPKSSV